MSDKTWKLNYIATREIPSEEEGVEPMREQVKIQIECLRVSPDKICVDFQRKGGSSILFYDKTTILMEQLDLWNNVSF